MDELGEYLKADKTIALVGSSGVGKSTLVNALAGREVMKTGAIRQKRWKGTPYHHNAADDCAGLRGHPY